MTSFASRSFILRKGDPQALAAFLKCGSKARFTKFNSSALNAKLFAGGRYFLCRHCYNMSYSSQSEARHDRMLRRTNKLWAVLGGEPGTAYFIALKPKGMWQRTFQRKRFAIQWCENKANQLFLSKFSNLLSAEERAMYFDE